KGIITRGTDESWRVQNVTSDMVIRAAPQVRILPTRFPESKNVRLAGAGPGIDKCIGINVSAQDIVEMAFSWPAARIVFPAMPSGKYDFIATLPQGSSAALQQELNRELHLTGRRETRNTEVLLLKVRRPHASGLRPPIPNGV